MLLRKTVWFWKSGLADISFVLMFSISGCSNTPPEEQKHIKFALKERMILWH